MQLRVETLPHHDMLLGTFVNLKHLAFPAAICISVRLEAMLDADSWNDMASGSFECDKLGPVAQQMGLVRFSLRKEGIQARAGR
jgi:hypothetical protein